jgi:hypothetical protein
MTVTYAVGYPAGDLRYGTLREALTYATGARDTGWITPITGTDGAPVRYVFDSRGNAVVPTPPPLCTDCKSNVSRWRDARYWAFCEACCAERSI